MLKKPFIPLLLLAAVAFWFFGGKLFASMPPLTLTSTHLLVGNPPGDRALYTLNAPCEIHAASLGYEFNSMSMGDFLPKLGARGILSCMNPDQYKAIHNVAARTNTCMAPALNNCQQNGQIQHLILIPKDPAALDQMRRASLPAGQSFHLKGRYLTLQEGTLKGHPFNFNLNGATYFLIESLSQN